MATKIGAKAFDGYCTVTGQVSVDENCSTAGSEVPPESGSENVCLWPGRCVTERLMVALGGPPVRLGVRFASIAAGITTSPLAAGVLQLTPGKASAKNTEERFPTRRPTVAVPPNDTVKTSLSLNSPGFQVSTNSLAIRTQSPQPAEAEHLPAQS